MEYWEDKLVQKVADEQAAQYRGQAKQLPELK
jgi:hypothetical protein